MDDLKFRLVCKDMSGDIFFLHYRLDDFFNGLNLGHNGRIQEIVSKDLFTGRKDKHGKDIYENDILHWNYMFVFSKKGEVRKDTYAQVIWSPVGYGFTFANRKGRLWSIDMEEAETVGNIHENPELLEGNNLKE